MVMRVVETVRRDKVKRVNSRVMYRNVERDRGKVAYICRSWDKGNPLFSLLVLAGPPAATATH
jgi:hypothetical protein